MSNTVLYSIIYIFGVLISAIAQVLLKKSADEKKENIIKEYLNVKTIIAYTIFFSATLCTVFAYKYVPLSFGPILESLQYIFVAALGYFLLKEKIKKKKLIGLIIIIIGVFIYSL